MPGEGMPFLVCLSSWLIITHHLQWGIGGDFKKGYFPIIAFTTDMYSSCVNIVCEATHEINTFVVSFSYMFIGQGQFNIRAKVAWQFIKDLEVIFLPLSSLCHQEE